MDRRRRRQRINQLLRSVSGFLWFHAGHELSYKLLPSSSATSEWVHIRLYRYTTLRFIKSYYFGIFPFRQQILLDGCSINDRVERDCVSWCQVYLSHTSRVEEGERGHFFLYRREGCWGWRWFDCHLDPSGKARNVILKEGGWCVGSFCIRSGFNSQWGKE